MAKKLVVFGSGDTAELAHYYFSKDSEHEVVAFTLDEEYIEGDTFCSLPIVPFADVQSAYPPEEHSLFIALGFLYRYATIVFFLAFTYVELIDKTTYLNHSVMPNFPKL